MGYFGSSLGGLPGVGFGGSTMFMPNAYGGYSTIAAGTPAGQEASYQLSSLRNMLGGPGGGRAAFSALAPYEFMAVKPMDMGAQMQRTFGQAGINLGQATGLASGYMDQLKQKMGGQQGGSKTQSGGGGGGPPPGAAYGQGQQRNPLDFLSNVFAQYGSGGGGKTFGSGWAY